jgi:hypothetical protein
MNNSTEKFTNTGSGAVGGGNFAGSGSFINSQEIQKGQGGKQYGSFDYASVSAISGAMSGENNKELRKGVIKNGAKTGTFTGGSFGGFGKYGVGFKGIKAGSTLPASSSASLYMKPELTFPQPNFYNKETKQKETLPYGKIDKNITEGISKPLITNKYDNVGCDYATQKRGPKFPYDLKNKNLTGYYGYSGYGYGFDPFYWGYGPFYPLTGNILNYPNPPFDYETLMQEQINADNLVNTIQNQLADQYMESNKKEGFQMENKYCYKNDVIMILAVILIIYLLLTISLSETEKKINFFR